MSLRCGGVRFGAPILVGAVMVLAACGSETPATKHATAAATHAAAPVPEELVGTWIGKLGPATGSSDYDPGRYTMVIHADGTTDVFRPGANLGKECSMQELCNSHSIEASGERLTVGDTYSCV